METRLEFSATEAYSSGTCLQDGTVMAYINVEEVILKDGDKVTFGNDPKIYILTSDLTMSRRVRAAAEAAQAAGVHVILMHPAQTRVFGVGVDSMVIDELTSFGDPIAPSKPSPKRQALLAQLERAKLSRNKNLIRDLTRQLEKVW
jgi:hypothetical protein